MTRMLPRAVPEAVVEWLRGELGAAEDTAILVIATRDGWPHAAMISRGELAIVGERSLRLALWPRSSMTETLKHERRATLSLVLDGVAYALRVRVAPAGQITTPLGGRLERFDAELDHALADEAPYATLTSGIRFRLNDPAAVLARWAQVRAALVEP